MGENREEPASYVPRVYPLDAHDLTEEQIAVVFAMTSRRPEAFDEIAQQVSQEKAADFHERWVLGYGHASVAEHAVVHLAVENVSRLACDALEDNRLASYTEKSSRYQVMPPDYFHFPQELEGEPELSKLYQEACQHLFQGYRRFIDGCMDVLRRTNVQGEKERESAYNLRLRRIATDSCRAVLPAATLTNVGITANARALEHAITKLMSSGLAEERAVGLDLREQGQKIAPTLIKYAERNSYLERIPAVQQEMSNKYASNIPAAVLGISGARGNLSSHESDVSGRAGMVQPEVRLVQWDRQAEEKVTAALLYRQAGMSYEEVWARVLDMTTEARQEVIGQCMAGLGPHDAPVRELELVDYTFEFLLDYGAYREFKRHRMMSYIPQPLTVDHGFGVPQLVKDAGLESQYQDAIGPAEVAFREVQQGWPPVAQYLVTHSHYRRVLAKMNLRECYHLFKLRTSELAHFAIRSPVQQAMKLAVETHPGLFRHLLLRDYPEWWRFRETD